MPNAGNIIGGHKANLNNPNTSEESKEHSRQVLDNEYDGGDTDAVSGKEKDPTRVAAGLKATTNNPNVSDEAKESAAERLEKLGAS